MTLKDQLIACGAVKFGDFTLASGAKSNYYVDIKKASTNPVILKAIGEAIAPHAKGYDHIAGMELGAVPIAVTASLASGIPYLIVRKESKKYGTGKRIEGDFQPGARVLVVEDVTTTGGSSLQAIEVLREAGLKVDRCITVVDRQQGATGHMADAHVHLSGLVTAKELLEGRV
ncbi:MAG TPA: orotate phosphoribosyltransferase [Candidatus Thermoplasmatota archaeon]|nr:orotate phosphoribosyltransferase [Candidatus Thermoplasmatota archaeon]